MKAGFHQKLVNGPFEDPCLYVRISREKRALQFDLGDISRLTQSEIHRITDVFVSHAHIDHFIGFDLLLRVILRREKPLNIYGPPNITACVAGKLRGYAWNLISGYPTVINVHAFNGKSISRSVFRAKTAFRREGARTSGSDGLLISEPLFSVKAVRLTHDTPCLAYSLEEEVQINIDKDVLLKKGLQVGPWLSNFKKVLRESPDRREKIEVGGKRYSISDLADIARITEGQKICYATDLAMTKNNLEKLRSLAQGADVLYCEAYFLEEDRERAVERFHLTAETCGKTARKAGVRRLVPIHFSPKYTDRPEDVFNEAMASFSGNGL
jgi:ribonuclease Z